MRVWDRLSAKLIGSVVIVSLAMCGATFMWQSVRQRRAAEATLLEKARAVSMQFLAVRSYMAQSTPGDTDPATFRHLEPEAVAQATGQIFGDIGHTQVREVWIGAQEPAYRPDAFESEALASFPVQIPASGQPGEPAYWQLVSTPDGERFRYVHPIYLDHSCLDCHTSLGHTVQAGQLMGAISISVPSAPFKQDLATQLREQLLFAGTLFLATVAALAVLLRRLVTRPLEQLTLRARAIGAGDLESRPALPRRDELGLLSETMEGMARQLKSLYDGLEAQVEARTRELQEMNRTLQEQSRELEAKSRELARANRLKSDFLASVSHELRTPLSSILAFTELLLDEQEGLSLEQREYLEEIRTSSERLYRQINDLLDMARIEAGMMRLELEAVPVAPLLASAARQIGPLAEQKGLTLEVRPPHEPVTIRADREKTLQVLGNLLSNAVKFTPQGGRIEVGAGLDRPGWARIWVRDSGIGIPPDQLDRIFEKFHQVERPGGPKPPGSGLGLTLAHHLVTLHGGRLWAESRPGEGATFTFEMPLWSPPAAAESAKEVGSCAQGTDSRRG